jgi:hypothetical protein
MCLCLCLVPMCCMYMCLFASTYEPPFICGNVVSEHVLVLAEEILVIEVPEDI